METAAHVPPPTPLEFRQAKPLLRWLGFALAAAGWCVSLALLLISGGLAAKPFLQAVCGGDETSDCASVLMSPQAYVPLGTGPGAMRLPVSAFGMAYFAFVALWYLFIGPPTRSRRVWHLAILAVVAIGVWQSVVYIGIMHSELHRWCRGCLLVHGINGLLLLVSLLGWPWRKLAAPVQPHPVNRLALATICAGLLALTLHLTASALVFLRNVWLQQTAAYAKVLYDPEFLRWDFSRQPVANIPLHADEVFAGPADAPNTAVVFGDFQCTYCRDAHEALVATAQRHPGRLRVAFRYYPQDPECNSNPRYRGGGHLSACRAARAAEAARRVGGRDAHLAVRAKLWAEQSRLPNVPYAQRTAAQRRLFEDWAAEIGLDRQEFTAAMDAPETAARIAADIQLADRLGATALPVVYLNGKLLRGWSKPEVWDALLAKPAPTTALSESQPAPSPAAR